MYWGEPLSHERARVGKPVWIYLQQLCVKYSLADNMGQGKYPTVLSQSDATAWQLFPLDDDQTYHSKDGGSAYSVGQLWEEITGAWSRVHISTWEFDGNIRPTNWMEDNEKFCCSRKLIRFNISTDFVYTQLNVKTVLY